MEKLKILKIILAAVLMTGSYSQASTTGFDGTEVEFAVYCCSEPTQSNLISDVLSAVVGSKTEYPFIENSGGRVISADIDISDSQIDVDYTEFSTTSSGSFNGYVFVFKPSSTFPKIDGVSLNSASTFDPNVIDLSFESDTIRISLPEQQITPNSRILLDVSFVSELTDNDCIASYTINGALTLPCVSVPDGLGGTTMYKADLNLIPLSNPFSFKLLEALQIDEISINSNNCIATYNANGFLNIPCVLVPDAFGDTVMYQADMGLIPSSSPFTFKLIEAQPIN